MTLRRRQFLRLSGAAVALPFVSRIARAQGYPSRPVKLIIGYPPGGSADITARLIGAVAVRTARPALHRRKPSRRRHQHRDRGGDRAPPDGYTLLLVAPANAINATLYEKLNHDFLRDIVPIAGLIRFPNVVVVNPSRAGERRSRS